MSAPAITGRRVVAVGAGRTGTALARFAAARGAIVTLCDEKDGPELQAAVGDLPAAVRIELGPLRPETIGQADLVVLSPGVPLAHPVVARARAAGVAVTGEVELASRFIAAPIVAITGTNGKSTVTALCGEVARATGRPTFVGGNFGTPLIEAVGDPAAAAEGIVVCEVSSFQLETCETFHPRAAAVLNITPDHLDRHGSMRAYADAKMRIARNLRGGDVLVVNEDDLGAVDACERHAQGWLPVLAYSTRGRPRPRFAQPLGGDGMVELDAGGFLDGESLVIRHADARGRMTEERYPAADLSLVGRHNLGNALAAFLLMRGAGLATADEVRAGAQRFRPLPHRMELVGEHRGARYYDDSKGTNVAAVVASIDGFPSPIILIAGGRDKGGSYAPLREALVRNIVRGVIVLGEAAERIASAVEGVAPVRRAASMDEAVVAAAALAADGDAVVLSPACSSFDMFRDYAHRGSAFRAAVENLRAPH